MQFCVATPQVVATAEGSETERFHKMMKNITYIGGHLYVFLMMRDLARRDFLLEQFMIMKV